MAGNKIKQKPHPLAVRFVTWATPEGRRQFLVEDLQDMYPSTPAFIDQPASCGTSFTSRAR